MPTTTSTRRGWTSARAWTGWRDGGFRRIGLVGVSLGAVKVAHYLAKTKDPRVTAMAGPSPVRLSHSYYLTTPGADEYLTFYRRAEDLVAAGKPDALFKATFPLSTTYGAAAFIDKHGPAEKYDIVKLAAKVSVPQLYIAGTLETHPRLLGRAAAAYEAARRLQPAHFVMVEGADHTFPGMSDRLAREIIDWLGSLGS